MPNTPTTPASVESRLTDEEIINLAHVEERYLDHKTAAVLRDYVRLRKTLGAVTEKVAECRDCDAYNYTEYCREAIEDIERIFVEAEKGEADAK